MSIDALKPAIQLLVNREIQWSVLLAQLVFICGTLPRERCQMLRIYINETPLSCRGIFWVYIFQHQPIQALLSHFYVIQIHRHKSQHDQVSHKPFMRAETRDYQCLVRAGNTYTGHPSSYVYTSRLQKAYRQSNPTQFSLC